MESRVGTSTIFIGLIPILQVVLNVAELVVGGNKVVMGYCCALFNSKKSYEKMVSILFTDPYPFV